ncbi:PREDICTED: uncharacterized protein LOC106791229 isoform X1 [Polistes canadensis]|uniref:uncharacterized protein LOC106791229 isoform X1 n=1 Tax=Polistes canadensis TaxID=91411 RepID=UPI00071902AA|nr:PREDICTED: uncharacterized protein LOC106791229 isoform X1 [Polistes canadensis]KAI4486498.1 hypothetical protein M0804_005868 [Polistes exclamans]
MYNAFKLLIITLYYVTQYVNAQYCYPNYCENVFTTEPVPGSRCLLKPIKNNDCIKLRFDGWNHVPSEEYAALFQLSAYVSRTGEFQGKATTFNLSVTDINFLRLTTRYQSLMDENISTCTHIAFYGNTTDSVPNKFFLSCPFTNQSYEGSPYRLEYFVSRKTLEYSKKLVFIIPHHESIDENNDVTTYLPFIYIDVSDALLFTLYIQPVPAKFNVTRYRIWLTNNSTGVTNEINLSQPENGEHIKYNFSIFDGIYYFKVAAMHPNCSIYGCINATSPFISIREASHRLLIMIISIIWIPPVILYALYHIYKLCKKNAKKDRKKPNCLIVYSPTRESHITVMTELTKYLRCCNINAMIDMFDISETVSKDVELWCRTAFNSADIILIVTSPPSNKHIPIKYENIDSYILQLIRENYGQRNKRYYILQLPYCKPTDLPDEAQRFQRFRMPEELAKLVRTVHQVDYVTFFGLSNKEELLESIKLAQMEMLDDGTTSDHKSADETDDLLPSVVSPNNITNQDLNNEDNNSTSMNVLKNEHNMLKTKYSEIEDGINITVHLDSDEQ